MASSIFKRFGQDITFLRDERQLHPLPAESMMFDHICSALESHFLEISLFLAWQV